MLAMTVDQNTGVDGGPTRVARRSIALRSFLDAGFSGLPCGAGAFSNQMSDLGTGNPIPRRTVGSSTFW